MSSHKIFLLAGAAAFVSFAVLAAEFQGKNIPSHASAVVGFDRFVEHASPFPTGDTKAAKCGTAFGAELHSPDGLISWNDTTGTDFDTAGAADFTCSAKTKVKEVWVSGYDPGVHTTEFNVTFYKNDGAGGSDEANDARVLCAYTGIMGAGGGGYGDFILTQLKLPTPCKLKPGKYWVSVQNNDSAGPWYWEMSSTLQGSPGDWVDRHRTFGDFCKTFDNDQYLVDCLGYAYPDYMLELH
jgi:hypothetical protein